MNLLPDITFDYDRYWQSVHTYNQWFIKLRNFAVIMLVLFLISISFLFQIKLNTLQIFGITGTTVFIFFYNQYFNFYISKNDGESLKTYALQYSLLQIIFDLISLSFIVYLTGGIEAPLFLFFIFHMIIGSIILPDKIIYAIAFILVSIFSALSLLEYNYVIPHQSLKGFYRNSFFQDPNFLFGFLFTFSVMLIVSIYLTKKIVGDLYNREKELKDALEELNQAEASKQKYIIAVVHELKSPIAAATSYLELVTGGFVGKISNDVDDKVNKAKIRLNEAIENINNILHVSKFKLLNRIEKEQIDLNLLISEIVEKSASLIQKKNLNLQLNDKLKNRYKIQADRLLMHLAFSNLISNAIKYSSKNGTVVIDLTELKEDIKIIIADDGIGIPPNELSKIFEDYYRASNAKKNKIEGTGTGLSVVRQIISAHSGTLTVNSPSYLSKPNKPGTSFTVILKNG
jgi:signal transduction histidine kinase